MYQFLSAKGNLYCEVFQISYGNSSLGDYAIRKRARFQGADGTEFVRFEPIAPHL
jgi:hypothetical protein